MNEKRANVKLGLSALLAIVILAAAIVVVASATVQKRDEKRDEAGETAAVEQWEYLIVAGANSNLTPSGNPNMRKEPAGSFGREAFVLEQQMDKLGAKGWELVSVSGHPSDPIYYFKRRK
jgi:hypothetical protein